MLIYTNQYSGLIFSIDVYSPIMFDRYSDIHAYLIRIHSLLNLSSNIFKVCENIKIKLRFLSLI